MYKFIAPALILASTSAFAATTVSAPKSFTRDGVTYTYTIAQEQGHYVIEGKDSFGKPFRLKVAGGRVRGNYANAPVGFVHKSVSPVAGSAQAD